MRNRTPNGRMALLCFACLTLAVSLVGCGGGNGTYNPTLTGGGGTPPPVASFTLTITPASQSQAAGTTTNYVDTVTSVNGFSSPVTFSITGLPTGATATFAPPSVTPTANGAVGNLSITTSATAAPGSLTGTIQSVGKPSRDATPPGTYTLTVTATGGGVTRQENVTITVNSVVSDTVNGG